MSSIFPLRETVTQEKQGGPRLLDLDDETADEVFEALAAQTTRQIFLALHEEPQTASDLAEKTDTSVQNVQYHLGKLKDVDLIDAVDTWYSERGSEMDVYAPTDESLVLFAGTDKERSIRSIFNRLVGVLSLLVPTSLLAGWAASRSGTQEETVGVDDTDGEDLGVETVDMPEDGVTQTDPSGTDGPTLASEDEGSVVMKANETDGAELVVAENRTDDPVLLTDGGNATQLPEGALTTTTETAAIDPALAAGFAFFCGGLVGITALWAWYGTPE